MQAVYTSICINIMVGTWTFSRGTINMPKSTLLSLVYMYQNTQFENIYSNTIDIYSLKEYKYAHKLNFSTRRMNNHE